MMKMPILSLGMVTFRIFACVFLMSGCMTTANRGDVYSRGEAKREMTVRFGVVESVRDVKLEGTYSSGTGTLAGAGLGAIAGSGMGHGHRAHGAGGVAGAVVGGLIGSAVEQAITDKDGLEITVKLDQSGKLVAVVQEKTQEVFRTGDRVRILRTEAIQNPFGAITPATVRVAH